MMVMAAAAIQVTTAKKLTAAKGVQTQYAKALCAELIRYAAILLGTQIVLPWHLTTAPDAFNSFRDITS